MTTTQEPKRLAYRLAEAAKELGISRTALYELRRRGGIRAKLVAGVPVITRAEIERVLGEAQDA